jgi:GT2 family glycosyltransferase
MNVFVVIVSYNGAPWIRGALDSVRASQVPCTTIVVDNASSDGTAGIVRNDYPEVLLVEQPANTGFGRGNNTGIRQALAAGADYIFLLNQDAFMTPETVGPLLDFLERHPAYGIASPLHCSPDLDSLDHQTLRGYFQRYAPAYLSDACLGRTRPHYEIHGVNAAAWMARAAVFRDVGGFDPLFFMYGEDDDLITRLHYHEKKFALLPTSRIVHLRARSPAAPMPLPKHLWRRSERTRSKLLLPLKHPEGRVSGKLLRFAAEGFVMPLARFLSSHDWQELLANYLGALRVLLETPVIFRHAAICRRPGCHFIDENGT